MYVCMYTYIYTYTHKIHMHTSEVYSIVEAPISRLETHILLTHGTHLAGVSVGTGPLDPNNPGVSLFIPTQSHIPKP